MRYKWDPIVPELLSVTHRGKEYYGEPKKWIRRQPSLKVCVSNRMQKRLDHLYYDAMRSRGVDQFLHYEYKKCGGVEYNVVSDVWGNEFLHCNRANMCYFKQYHWYCVLSGQLVGSRKHDLLNQYMRQHRMEDGFATSGQN